MRNTRPDAAIRILRLGQCGFEQLTSILCRRCVFLNELQDLSRRCFIIDTDCQSSELLARGIEGRKEDRVFRRKRPIVCFEELPSVGGICRNSDVQVRGPLVRGRNAPGSEVYRPSDASAHCAACAPPAPPAPSPARARPARAARRTGAPAAPSRAAGAGSWCRPMYRPS